MVTHYSEYLDKAWNIYIAIRLYLTWVRLTIYYILTNNQVKVPHLFTMVDGFFLHSPPPILTI